MLVNRLNVLKYHISIGSTVLLISSLSACGNSSVTDSASGAPAPPCLMTAVYDWRLDSPGLLTEDAAIADMATRKENLIGEVKNGEKSIEVQEKLKDDKDELKAYKELLKIDKGKKTKEGKKAVDANGALIADAIIVKVPKGGYRVSTIQYASSDESCQE